MAAKRKPPAGPSAEDFMPERRSSPVSDSTNARCRARDKAFRELVNDLKLVARALKERR
jgi:hypothetical protein